MEIITIKPDASEFGIAGLYPLGVRCGVNRRPHFQPFARTYSPSPDR